MLLGRVVGVFGVRGEIKIAPSRIGADARLDGILLDARFDDSRTEQPIELDRPRAHKRVMVAAIKGVATATDAERFVGATLWTTRELAGLRAGEYFDDDLIGCRVHDGGRDIGTVIAVQHYPAQDVLELEGGGLVPMVGAFIKRVDTAARTIEAELPPGLVEGEPL